MFWDLYFEHVLARLYAIFMYTYRRQTFKMCHCGGVYKVSMCVQYNMSYDTHTRPKRPKSYTTPYFAITVSYHMSPVITQLFCITMKEAYNIGTYVLYRWSGSCYRVYIPQTGIQGVNDNQSAIVTVRWYTYKTVYTYLRSYTMYSMI